MDIQETSLLVIGAGPGGYVCAIRAAQLGIKTTIVESVKPGGTCLNVGCIPSKAIIHASDEFHRLTELASSDKNSIGISCAAPSIAMADTIRWKDGIVSRLNSGVSSLLKKAGVSVLHGQARFQDGKSVVVSSSDGEIQVNCQHAVIATGSEAIELADLPFGEHVYSSTEILSITEIPKSLCVVGGGYIGLELGISFAKLGSSVTVIEGAERVLPQYEKELTAPVVKRMQELEVRVLTSTTAYRYDNSTRSLQVSDGSNSARYVSAEKVLVTVGRKPRLEGWGLTELQLTHDKAGIAIDDVCRTSMLGVYAIGDVTGEPMLAHRAMAQGDMVARHLAGENVSWDKLCIPAVCFTDPEIVSVGLSPGEADATSEDVHISKFPFMANGRAMTLQREEGFIRVVSSKKNHVILGIQAVGVGVSELSAAFALAIEMGARAEDVAATIHAHPTLSEEKRQTRNQGLPFLRH